MAEAENIIDFIKSVLKFDPKKSWNAKSRIPDIKIWLPRVYSAHWHGLFSNKVPHSRCLVKLIFYDFFFFFAPSPSSNFFSIFFWTKMHKLLFIHGIYYYVYDCRENILLMLFLHCSRSVVLVYPKIWQKRNFLKNLTVDGSSANHWNCVL